MYHTPKLLIKKNDIDAPRTVIKDNEFVLNPIKEINTKAQ